MNPPTLRTFNYDRDTLAARHHQPMIPVASDRARLTNEIRVFVDSPFYFLKLFCFLAREVFLPRQRGHKSPAFKILCPLPLQDGHRICAVFQSGRYFKNPALAHSFPSSKALPTPPKARHISATIGLKQTATIA